MPTNTAPTKTATKPAADKTNTKQEVKDYAACVAGGGKVTTTNNSDGTVSLTCTLNNQSFSGPKKSAKDGTTKAAPFAKKAEANMDPTTTPKAEAATKLTKFSIETDGTKDGTKILLNGKEIPNLESANFYFYPTSSYEPVNVNFTTRDPDVKPGELHSYTTYRLKCYPCYPHSCASTATGNTVTNTGQSFSFDKSTASADPLARPATATPAKTYAKAFA